jgi:hypothetical protein
MRMNMFLSFGSDAGEVFVVKHRTWPGHILAVVLYPMRLLYFSSVEGWGCDLAWLGRSESHDEVLVVLIVR